jgi:hypothetical protein
MGDLGNLIARRSIVQKVRFMIEYACFPLWLYEESTGQLIGPEVPPELTEYPQVLANLDKIQMIWDGLFIDNGVDFGWNGFESEGDKRAFVALVHKTIEMLHEALDGTYIIIDDSSHALRHVDDPPRVFNTVRPRYPRSQVTS